MATIDKTCLENHRFKIGLSSPQVITIKTFFLNFVDVRFVGKKHFLDKATWEKNQA